MHSIKRQPCLARLVPAILLGLVLALPALLPLVDAEEEGLLLLLLVDATATGFLPLVVCGC